MDKLGEALITNPSKSLPHGGRVQFWTWRDAEDRLVEAMRHWWRSSDNEARFALGGRISSIWRQAFTDKLALIEQLGMEPSPPSALPLSRGDMKRMAEASEWLAYVPERDRRLVIAVLIKLAKGAKVVPWLVIWKALGRGRPGPEGLRSRYSRAITDIANALKLCVRVHPARPTKAYCKDIACVSKNRVSGC